MITELPVLVPPPDGEATWGAPPEDHPMRKVTRAVAFDPLGWTPERQAEVVDLFDSLAPEWHTRDVPGREVPLVDALDRGLAAAPAVDRRVALELGGGTGIYSSILGAQFPTLVTADISGEMLRLADGAVIRLQADGARLPVPDRSIDALVLINMFLFPQEADRVLADHGVVLWVNSRGPQTPIHLTASEVDDALPGTWEGVASTAGWGTWSVYWRRR